MEKIVPIEVLQKIFELSPGEVKRYFKRHSKNVQPTYSPLNPKAGEVYLYLIQDELSKSKFCLHVLYVRID